MKGYIRIGGAIFCGVAIIAMAFYLRSHGTSDTNGALVVLETPQKEYIESNDTNKNGTPDWEDELKKNIIASIEASTTLASEESAYTPPTTFTGKFSEAFFKDYLTKKGMGASLEDPTELINAAVSGIEKSTESKRYSRLEIVVIPDTLTDVREYGNSIAQIILSHKATGPNEATTLQKALETNDPSLLEDLEPIRKGYESMIAQTQAVPVPESLVQQQLNLLNAYEAILTDVRAMEGMFNDPLYGLARMKRYEGDVSNLTMAFKNTASALLSTGITYANDESGIIFYLFNS